VRAKKTLGADGRWRLKGRFTTAPKRLPKSKRAPVPVATLGDALRALAAAGIPFKIELPSGVPVARRETPIPQSGKRRAEKQDEPLFRFRHGDHIDMRQARGDIDAIKTWIGDWGAEWHRNRDGSYQAMIAIGEDDPPTDEPESGGVLDTLQTAAEELPGPCLMRYGLWYRDGAPQKRTYGSPTPKVERGGIELELHHTRLVREFDGATAMAEGFRRGQPEEDRGRLQVMFPSIKKERGDEN